MTFTEQLRDLDACKEAIKWVNGRGLRKCWQVADRADWMLWLAGKVNIDRKTLVLAACDCAETALKYALKGEVRPRIAIETARAWCRGEATIEEVRKAAADADAADADAANAAAAYAAADAANAAAYAADAAADAAGDAARKSAHKKMCRFIRKRIPVELIEEKLQ